MKRYFLLAGLVAPLGACMGEPGPAAPPHDEWDDKLNDRVVDYGAALRIASLRLTGELPTLAEIDAVANATDEASQKTAYEALIQQYLASPKFTRQMFRFSQDFLRLGDTPETDTAPAFLAQVIVDNRSYLDVLTASTGTCPTYNAMTNTFTAGTCNNGTQAVGLLTHPGMLAANFSNLAFRRVRWVQETFACSKFPAEIAKEPKDVGGATPYTGTFPFDSIAGAPIGRVNFKDTSSVICANCHSNLNHIAPLFAHFDDKGLFTTGFSVPVPLPDNPMVAMSDYLPSGESTAWRMGVPVTDMRGLGTAMAADNAIAECAVARVWNWALGRPDIVDAAAKVPGTTIETQVADFKSGGYHLRDAMYRVFTSDDFVRF
ncbi:MAG TPA: DUF1549 domain-containing protein [Kofleriaceae bacterium]|jgi:hypothetical protein|nr:DUF1549 domain-containing protein [Kofleriaceae bacterium]